MKSNILKAIIGTFILGANLVFSDTGKVIISRADHLQGQNLHGWCQPRSQHLSAG